MTLTDKIRTVAVKDGWVSPLNLPHLADKDGHRQTAFSDMKYLTSMDWLHPIAMRVVDELMNFPSSESGFIIYEIRLDCSKKPNEQGQYLDLFNSVYDGVVLLEKIKTEQP